MVIKLARKQNESLQKYLLNYQEIMAVFKAKSSDQGIFSLIKTLIPVADGSTGVLVVTTPCVMVRRNGKC